MGKHNKQSDSATVNMENAFGNIMDKSRGSAGENI